MKKFFTLIAATLVALSSMAIDKVEKKTVLKDELTTVDAISSANYFYLQGENGMMLVIPTGWDMKAATVNDAVGAEACTYKVVNDECGFTLIQVLDKDHNPRSIGWLTATEPYETTTFINRQPAGNNTIFGLGLNNRYGQDGANLALWEISISRSGKLVIKNVGITSYLALNESVAYPSDSEYGWKAYATAESGYDKEELSSAKNAVICSGYISEEDATAIAEAADDDALAAAINAAIDKIAAAEARANITKDADVTAVVTNPGFDNHNTTGWTSTNGGHIAGNTNFGLMTGADFVEQWTGAPNKLSDGSFLQTITNLPQGVYTLTAEMQNLQQSDNSNGAGFYLVANDAKTECTAPGTYAVKGIVGEDGTLTIGTKLEGCTGNWICVDNFTLTYVGSRQDLLDDLDEGIKAATYALNNYPTSEENDAALSTAVGNAADINKETIDVAGIVKVLDELADAVDAWTPNANAYYKKQLEDAKAEAEMIEEPTQKVSDAISDAEKALKNEEAIFTDYKKAADDIADAIAAMPRELTANDYHCWTDVNASAEITDATPWCEYKLNEATGMPYGNGNVDKLQYADLSNYDVLVVAATAGTVRALFNRDIDNGQAPDHLIDIPNNADQTAKYQTVETLEDGTTLYYIDLKAIVADYGYAHLHCIKGAFWQSVTVTSILVGSEDDIIIPTAISSVATSSVKAGKFVKNGRVVIINNGIEYNTNGIIVK